MKERKALTNAEKQAKQRAGVKHDLAELKQALAEMNDKLDITTHLIRKHAAKGYSDYAD
jgi:hypothetical protein